MMVPTKVMGVKSFTYCYPLIQKILKNKLRVLNYNIGIFTTLCNDTKFEALYLIFPHNFVKSKENEYCDDNFELLLIPTSLLKN